MNSVLKPPIPLNQVATTRTLFLAGSIEMGQAEDWQSRLTNRLQGLPDLTILNPRRDEWDDSWEQTIDNPQFREQVEWELAAQEKATLIAMYFAPETKAPITLLELGLFSCSGKLIVCCPDGYWRKGNIEVVCNWYNIPLVDSFEELVTIVQEELAT